LIRAAGGHSDIQSPIYLPDIKIMFTGDLVKLQIRYGYIWITEKKESL
jgi:hypothetical protein